jgi:anti-sigma factor RsiW
MEDDRITELDLQAYVDGQLDRHRRGAVERHLRTHADDAAKVARWAAQNGALLRLFDRVTEPPSPEDPAIPAKRGKGNRGFGRSTGGYAAFLLLGCALGWLGASTWPPGDAANMDPLLDGALAVREAEASPPANPDAVSSSLNWARRASMDDIHAPDLSRYGFKVLGGRVATLGPGLQAAQIDYGDGEGRRVTVQVLPRRPTPDPPIETERRGDVRFAFWRTGGLTFVLAGDVPRPDALALAKEAHRSMSRLPLSPSEDLTLVERSASRLRDLLSGGG